MNIENLKAQLRGAMRSWTIWFNAVIGTLLAAMPMAQESLPQVKIYVPDNWYSKLFLAFLIVNLILRAKTNASLADKGKKPE